jgi:hypothetical protein
MEKWCMDAPFTKLKYEVVVGWAGFFAHVLVNDFNAWAKKLAHPTTFRVQ